MSVPRISIITPTWKRHRMLLERCIPSVQAQGHPDVEHIVVSDGPDPELAELLAEPWTEGWKGLSFYQLPRHPPDPHYGVPCRLAGLELATGDLVGYTDDDDSLRPYHCHMLAAALDAHADAGFAVSKMMSHGAASCPSVIGEPEELSCGQVGTPMLMHRRELTRDVASWGPSSQFEDWELVARWLDAGVPYVRVDAVTCDCWPSLFRSPDPQPVPRYEEAS